MMYIFCAGVLTAICLCTVVTSVESESKVINQVGIKLCDYICSHCVGCSAYIYRTTNLTCDVYQQTQTAKMANIYKVSKDRERLGTRYNLTCKEGSRLYYSRSKNLRCSDFRFQQERKEKLTRILMFPACHKELPVQQLLLINNSVSIYLKMRTKSVRAVAYSAAMRTFIVAESDPPAILSMSLHDGNRTILYRNETVFAVAIDDRKELIFTGTRDSVMVMRTSGENLHCLIHGMFVSESLAVHSKRSVIFVQSWKYIKEYSYQGIKRHEIARGNIKSPLCIDTEKDVLYYVKEDKDGTKLMETLLENYSSRIITNVGRYELGIALNDSFILSNGFGRVVLITEDRKRKKMRNHYRCWVRFCAVP